MSEGDFSSLMEGMSVLRWSSSESVETQGDRAKERVKYILKTKPKTGGKVQENVNRVPKKFCLSSHC